MAPVAEILEPTQLKALQPSFNHAACTSALFRTSKPLGSAKPGGQKKQTYHKVRQLSLILSLCQGLPPHSLLKPLETCWNRLKLFETSWNLLKPFETYWTRLKPIETYYIKPIETSWSLLKPSETSGNFLKPLETYWNLLKPVETYCNL